MTACGLCNISLACSTLQGLWSTTSRLQAHLVHAIQGVLHAIHGALTFAAAAAAASVMVDVLESQLTRVQW